MRLDTPFVRLPLRADPARLGVEVNTLPAGDVVRLVAAAGDPTNDSAAGPLRPTPSLTDTPYLRQLLAALGSTLGRVRLVRTPFTPTPDTSHASLHRLRLLVPTDRGEVWAADTWHPSAVLPFGERLEIETVGSPELWEQVSAGERPCADPPTAASRPDVVIPFDPSADPPLATELAPSPAVMTPWEVECLFAELNADLTADPPAEWQESQWAFLRGWRNLWAAHGAGESGRAAFGEQLKRFDDALAAFAGRLTFSNGVDAVDGVRQVVVRAAMSVNPTTPNPTRSPVAASPASAPAPADEPLRSVFTTNLVGLFEELGLSLLVTTYQAGKLVILRAKDGKLNTHFRTMNSPMGLAVKGDRLAVGTKEQVWEYRNRPAEAFKLEPIGKHDACYLPRVAHHTGDIRVHEIGWAGDELWVVNTRFSCLCTLDRRYSFVPRWKPTFVSALAPEDRCHLNGLCIAGDPPRPKYVTCLGATDTAAGWRANKKDGGLLIDVETNEVLARGLSMPHSPRLYDGKLWVLESGYGGLGYLDAKTGKVVRVATLPGFTRGVDFVGPFAFVGLSQVRETAAFSGIPITESLTERNCGVWVVDLRTGQTVGFLRFEEGVREIFAVHALVGTRFPDLLTDDDERLADTFVLPDPAG